MLRLDDQLCAKYSEPVSPVVTTWENRDAILAIMEDAAKLGRRLHVLWERSGSISRLSQDQTDELGLLFARLSDLGDALQRMA
jgi:hypothetical protein